MLAKMRDGDFVIFTADHGNDPTWRGTDHTREHVAICATVKGRPGKAVGGRKTYADIGESVAAHLGIAPGRHGVSFL
jgi:phosphopentomutase